MAERTVGFIGLGNMGGRMTRRLVEAGIEVIGYDTRPGAAEEVGAVPAADPADVAARTDVVLLSLPDSHVVEPVVRALLPSARAGATVVDLSTASPTSTQQLHAEAAERSVQYIDAGISGGAAAAEKGTLTIMAGGDADALARISWVFAPIAAQVHHMGGPGAGHTTKLLNNFLNAVSLAATAEVMVAGRKAGLDLVQLLDVLNTSSGVNFATQNRFPHIVRGDYLEGGLTGRLMTKDVQLYVDLLGRLGVPTLNAAGPLASFGLAENLGYGDQISNRVVDAIGDVSGGVRVHDLGGN
ncbi:3-hydroxyisobutyrate dehydrogenase [Pseudonocardia thermophila]|mgnify:CR=1 FL=1|jgi:3-hydroxyisobutyrate dehydrogenase and related beta-hydroxyacid dehydrogenases|uniref:3-hydroxyisobutyrate dehydrogenase n=1 Tax=Pseudonocardia thermophila TaxID=1848 RepID=A0A1M6T2K5_PSETH|nr:NAD(P)-dependent oxidoreductase [Pseudonocardia thermophila]SHK51130.1 3-hydroxyisobutyrate dehydrogenase [Pseudonocardia thermophila]